jgi:hypothetical protein
MGFSNLDKVGVLTEGFDQLGTMITWYNYHIMLPILNNWAIKWKRICRK